MKRTQFSQGKELIGRMPEGIDLLEGLTRIVNDEEITVGRISVYGTVRSLSLTQYDSSTKFNRSINSGKPHNVCSLSGTISTFKRRSLPRLSGVFSDGDSGDLVGGILALGTVTGACEVVIVEMKGGALSRDFDLETGLPLWKKNTLLLPELDSNVS